MSTTKGWIGPAPATCNICEEPLTHTFVDGKLMGRSSWAIMCPTCWILRGVTGLGTGQGQKYVKVNERWLKEEV